VRRPLPFLASILVVVAAIAVAARPTTSHVVATASSAGAHEGGEAEDRVAEADGGEEGEEGRGDPDFEEEHDATTNRLDALAEARTAGTFGDAIAATADPAPGWRGSFVLNPSTDDWEPAVATDPSDPYVYVLTTRYGEDKTCPKHCPTPFLALTVSDDGGVTWGPQRPICTCRGSGAQYDPTIEVVPGTGDVIAVFLNADRAGGFSTVYMRSSDHGATWTEPVHVYGKVSWTDKPEVTTNRSGKDVYVSWNGPQGGDLYVGQSHDFGVTWTQRKLTSSKQYFYAYDARVLSDGAVVFAESSVRYGGLKNLSGIIRHVALISRDRGATWKQVLVARVPVGEACLADGCSPDFYTGQASVVEDDAGHLAFAYEGPLEEGGPQRVYVKRSSDDGRTWGPAIVLSKRGENATQPRLASDGGGDVRIWYMQTANGDDPDAWNVWYRSSSDGGATWSAPIKLNDHPANAADYTHADGFDEIYGDYGEIAVTSRGDTVAAWGEGFSWNGPGGTWINVSR
jgi:BNR repeat protein